jgi:3-dehydroquinate dehydratase-1
MTIRIGELELGQIPRIAVPIDDSFTLQQASEATERGLDLLEARIDRFSRVDRESVVPFVKRFSRYPTLVTIRSRAEGGNAGLSDEERLVLFELLLPEAGAADIEISSKLLLPRVVECGQTHNKPVIGSFHDFEMTPDRARLEEIIEEGKQAGVDIVKLATRCESRRDLAILTSMLLEESEIPLIVVGMGRLGGVSRVLFPALGSLLTYAFIDEAVAPGQMSLEETRSLLEKFNLVG